MSASTLSRVLSATSARCLGHTPPTSRGTHASTALVYENEMHQKRYKDGTSIEEHFNMFRQLVVQFL